MEIRILAEEEKSKYYDEILKMLYNGDEEFVPPLSARSSTTQKDLSKTEKTDDGILKYFEEMKKQKIMIAEENDVLLAFVSYRENYVNNEIKEEDTPNIYLSTLIVKPEGRGKRLTQTMYDILFKTYEKVNIFTRTWSTNAAHIRILSKFSFDTLCTLENDRGAGIDTVYFVKRPE